MAAAKVTCFVCGEIDDNVSLLTSAKFDDCVEALQIRVALDLDMFDKNITKYCHPDCFHNFTNITSKHKADAKEQEERVLRWGKRVTKSCQARKELRLPPKSLQVVQNDAVQETWLFIEQEVLDEPQCFLFSYFYYVYRENLTIESRYLSVPYKPFFDDIILEVELLKKFGDQIKIITINEERVIVPTNVPLAKCDFRKHFEEPAMAKYGNTLYNEVVDFVNARDKSTDKEFIPPTVIKYYKLLFEDEYDKYKEIIHSLSPYNVFSIFEGEIITKKRINFKRELPELKVKPHGFFMQNLIKVPYSIY